MQEIKQKITALKNKIHSREVKLNKLNQRISDAKSNRKAVLKEINELINEIHKLEIEQLSETLEKNGITADDVAAAIAQGNIRNTVPEPEKKVSDKENAEEELKNEVSDS